MEAAPRPARTSSRDANDRVDYDVGWTKWSDMVRYYPSGVHRRRIIKSWVAALAPSSVLDVGCGTGELLCELRERLPGCSFLGVDQAAQQVERNRGLFPWAEFQALDLSASALDRRCDVVICSEVLEHVPDDERALDHLVAMTGRHLLLTVPAGPLYPLETGFGHLRHYDLAALGARLTRRGLRIARAEAWGLPFMTLFKWAANLRPEATLEGFGDGAWSPTKRLVGKALTALFYLNVPGRGPQLFVLAERPDVGG